ncbi:hypothetical protein VTN77DRAFT_812 [Rasamsonia byssochlamydoides]|uniref:uncharacterized protein n=1 Tax=Rasamsonia byssochlamydoides TaxID=89139 RepID=UPI0037433366
MDATAATQVQPLGDRSTNTHLQSSAVMSDNLDGLKAAGTLHAMEYHRQALQEKLKDGEKYVFRLRRSQNTYVSPSDDIMSPCTKKLSDLKGKRFKNAGKPPSLFAKLGKKSFEQSSASASASAAASPTREQE